MPFDADFEKWKRDHFSGYCVTKCEKMCCDMRNVSLYLYRDELLRLFDGKVDFENLSEYGIRAENTRNIFSLETKDFCPKFDQHTRKCLDYKHRSKSCREYPFIVENDSILIKSGCPLDRDSPEYRKLAEIASRHGKVIVKK